MIGEASHDQFYVSAPYPEGAIEKIAHYLSANHRLSAYFRPSRKIARATAGLIRTGRLDPLSSRLMRGSNSVSELIEVAPAIEVRRHLSRLWPLNSDESFHKSKLQFDRSVASRLREARGIFIGMPSASLDSFNKNAHLTKVFHEVDAHPISRNQRLRDTYGSLSTPELIPRARIDRIVAELEAADIALSPSSLVTSQLVQHGFSRENIVQSPYGIETERFFPTQRHEYSSTPTLIYIGQISYRKGIPFLLEVARKGHFHVQLVGPVVAPELLENLPSNVSYFPPQSHDKLSAMLSGSDAFVFPSIEDNFALVVLEAMAAGLPIITTTAVGSSELVTDHDGVILDPGDTDALLDAMNAIDPLSWEARQSRAEGFLQRIAQAKDVQDWASYARTVVKGIDLLR